MKISMSKKAIAVLGLLGSSAGFAATVTVQITENSFIPNDGLVNVGDFITVNVFGSGFPDTVGATLRLSFNDAAVAVRQPTLTNGIVLGAGSPFTGGIFLWPPDTVSFPVLGVFGVLGPLVGTLPTGNFGGNAAFTINFVAIGLGLANIQIVDDGQDFSWADNNLFAIPVTYTNTLSPQVIPVPAAAWLFGSALGLLGVARRRFG